MGNDLDNKIRQILDIVYAAGCIVTELKLNGELAISSITSDRFNEAKQAIQQLITEARIDEAKYARSRLLKVGSFEHKLQTERIEELEGKE